MIKIKHYRHVQAKGGYQWCDAFLVQVLHDPNASESTRVIVAYQDGQNARDANVGMKLESAIMQHVRIPRPRIPLFDPPQAKRDAPPDAATKPPALGPAFYND